MDIQHVEIGVCGLSCRLCPAFYRETPSKCTGCKSEPRMAVGCPFINCAVKKKGIEFCGLCQDNKICEKWKKHREMGEQRDSIVSYQKLEANISFIQKSGIEDFEEQQKIRERLLREMLREFNEGRSKSFYCIAATVLGIRELEKIIEEAKKRSVGLDLKKKSEVMHSVLDEIARKKNYLLKLRK